MTKYLKNTNLIKRIISSAFLFLSLLIILNLQNIFFIILLISIFIISCYEWKNLANSTFLILTGWIFILFSIYTTYEIKNFDNFNLIYFVLLICIGTDLGGFILGKIFKGPKLTDISPNKTYSGSLGGFILSLIFSWIYLEILDLSFFSLNFFDLEFIFITILLSLISQIGDLVVSFFKRKSNVKDTGKLIPGHGGLLDRIDGMLFVFPFFYLLTFVINF